jgi:hypothetical protein
MKPACLFILSGYVPLHHVAGSAFAGRVVCRALELDPRSIRPGLIDLGLRHIADINHMATPAIASKAPVDLVAGGASAQIPGQQHCEKHAHALVLLRRDCRCSVVMCHHVKPVSDSETICKALGVGK